MYKRQAYEMQFVVGQATGFEEEGGRLTRLKVTGSDGVTRVMPLDMLLVFFGLSPKLGLSLIHISEPTRPY